MEATIQIKGFNPGEALNKFLSDQVESLAQSDENLKSASLKLNFTDNYFHCNLTISIAGYPLSISLCDKDFYEVVQSAIDFASAILKNKHMLVAATNRRPQMRRYMLPKRMTYHFSAN